jgi:hypothetical protein
MNSKWAAEKLSSREAKTFRAIQNVLISIRIVHVRDDLPFHVGPHLGARLKLGTMIGPGLEAWTKVQPYSSGVVFPKHSHVFGCGCRGAKNAG